MTRKKARSTQPRREPRSALGAATVDAILGAVERILEKHGTSRLTTNHVAELAGVSIGSVYQYFPNKESLVGALQDKYSEDTLGRMRAALAGTEQLPIEAVVMRVGMAVMSAKQAQRPIHRYLTDLRTLSASADRYRLRLDAQVDLIEVFLANRADVTVENPRASAFVLVHAIEGIMEGATERPHVDALEVARAAVTMVTAFLKKRE